MRTLIIAPLLLSVAAFAQTTPVLHSRHDSASEARTRATRGVSTIPADASGEYELDQKGSVIQITIEHGRLTGYVTKMDHQTALTLFFDQTTIAGNRLSFTTKTVHGLRYSFHGTIVRGEAQTRSINGFYRLAGDLTAHSNTGNQVERISLKSTPRN
ncbi:MAG: hypothetical protein ACRD3F_08520 [Acidobacteriaceae bacterium]